MRTVVAFLVCLLILIGLTSVAWSKTGETVVPRQIDVDVGQTALNQIVGLFYNGAVFAQHDFRLVSFGADSQFPILACAGSGTEKSSLSTTLSAKRDGKAFAYNTDEPTAVARKGVMSNVALIPAVEIAGASSYRANNSGKGAISSMAALEPKVVPKTPIVAFVADTTESLGCHPKTREAVWQAPKVPTMVAISLNAVGPPISKTVVGSHDVMKTMALDPIQLVTQARPSQTA